MVQQNKSLKQYLGLRIILLKKVVYVEYPRKGTWTLGFVTSESTNENNEEFLSFICSNYT